MWAHLWTKSVNAPQEYVNLVLCRDVYHCAPDVLERQNAAKIYMHLTIMKVESDVEDLRRPKKKNAKLST